MTTWHEYVQQKGTLPEWPYPLRYGKVSEVVSDVLVIGGGLAGCRQQLPPPERGQKLPSWKEATPRGAAVVGRESTIGTAP